MKLYTVKSHITFTFDNKELEVKGEMSIKEGTSFSLFNIHVILI